MNWKCEDGRVIPISEMETEHIENVLAMLRRMGCVSPKTVAFYVTCSLPHGEAALDAFDLELGAVLDAPSSPLIDIFEDELKKRGIPT